MYEAGLLSVAAAIVLILKLPRPWLRRLLWLDIPVDIAVTAGFIYMFAGTYSGMMAAIVAGLLFSITLGIAKLFMGYERLSWCEQSQSVQWLLIRGRFSGRPAS